MSETVEGFVALVHAKNGTSAKGGWTLHSLKISDENGKEDDRWFGCGFNGAPCTADGTEIQKGDFVRFDIETNAKGQVNITTGPDGNTVDIKRKKNPPALSKEGEKAATKTYGRDDETIRYHAARSTAIEAVAVLLGSESLPVTAGKNKGDKAKRFDEVTAFIDKLTVQYFIDSDKLEDGTFRLIGLVADGRVEGHEPAPLPEDAEEAAPETANDSNARDEAALAESEAEPEAPADDDFE